MKLKVVSRSGKELVAGGVDVDASGTVEDLSKAIYRAKPKLYPSRQRLTLPAEAGSKKPRVLEAGKKLSDYDINANSQVAFKDLGPQIGYKTVFFWEYFGPVLVYALIYSLPQFVYPWHRVVPKNKVQDLALAYWSFHYTKRILETFLVHRFSHATMPIFNLVKNCSYYWGFAAYVAYFINHPLYTAPPIERAAPLFAFALLCQAANFWCHILLSRLRSPSGKGGYTIPRGFLFEYITCANYFCEILGWLAFTAGTQTVAAGLFIAAGSFQMALWAKAKHARLRKIFDGKNGQLKYPKRWIMFPPVF
ncbi:hypothetical protein WJX73_009328 [Symbiochloris irregularis]|uniref:3-oxo-5-alpha-steroid 4-dehydrogenase C-terminal domain-containing protein n=1 Tax=Symbiochloris irregularis TaxID=706552 RepID=A0AAW1Q486_9CHLO